MPLWSAWTAGAFLRPHCDALQARRTPAEPLEGYLYRPQCKRRTQSPAEPHSPILAVRRLERARSRPRARHGPPDSAASSRLHIPVSPYKPCERVYSLERVNIPPRLLPPALRRLCASWVVIYARRPCRSAASRCPGSAEKGPPRSGSPSFSAQFPADFRKISDPVLKIFSASFKNRIFIFSVRNSR